MRKKWRYRMRRAILTVVGALVLVVVGVAPVNAEVIDQYHSQRKSAFFEFDWTPDGYTGDIEFAEQFEIRDNPERRTWLELYLTTPTGGCEASVQDFDHTWSQGVVRVAFDAPCGHIEVVWKSSGPVETTWRANSKRCNTTLVTCRHSVSTHRSTVADATMTLNGDIIGTTIDTDNEAFIWRGSGNTTTKPSSS